MLVVDLLERVFSRELLVADRSLHFCRVQLIDFFEDVDLWIVPFRSGKWVFRPLPERFFHDLVVHGESVDRATRFVGGDILARLLFSVLIVQA